MIAEYQFIFSGKQRKQILFQGFNFSFTYERMDGVQHWKCTNKSCRAHLKLREGVLLETDAVQHSHEALDQKKIKKKLLRQELKEKVKELKDKFDPKGEQRMKKLLSAEEISELSKNEIESLRQSLYRFRQKQKRVITDGSAMNYVETTTAFDNEIESEPTDV